MGEALIKRLEEAKEGSRALSDEVLTALEMTGKGALRRKDWDALGKSHIYVGLYDPTGNLQDAVDLVPEGSGWGVDCDDFIEAWVGHGDDEDAWGHGKTAPLSLCIAILKAMETESAEEAATGANHGN